ncbi:MAG: glycosyltransferase family 4 protein [Rhodocyclaceae bacterium]
MTGCFASWRNAHRQTSSAEYGKSIRGDLLKDCFMAIPPPSGCGRTAIRHITPVARIHGIAACDADTPFLISHPQVRSDHSGSKSVHTPPAKLLGHHFSGAGNPARYGRTRRLTPAAVPINRKIPANELDMDDKKPVVLLAGPERSALSGVSTHLNLLFASSLAQEFDLKHFQVGSEGRKENVVGRGARLIFSPFSLAASILSKHADIVHLNTSLNQRAYWRDLVYMLVARVCGARVIYQVHGGDLPRQFAGRSRIMRALLRISLSLPDALVLLAKCEFEAYRVFIPGADIRVLPNAIDFAPYAALRRENSDGEKPLRLLYIGRFSYQKGLSDVLRGLQLVRLHGIEANLTIAGSGPEESALHQLVERLGLGKLVTFSGPVFDEAKIKLLGAADVFLLPTFHSEGLPYALLECMAAGVPPITTRVGAIPDVAFAGVHAIFVPPQNPEAIARAIEQLAGNRALLAQMSAACRKRIATRYSIEYFAGEFSRLYSDVDASRRGAIARLRNKTP